MKVTFIAIALLYIAVCASASAERTWWYDCPIPLEEDPKGKTYTKWRNEGADPGFLFRTTLNRPGRPLVEDTGVDLNEIDQLIDENRRKRDTEQLDDFQTKYYGKSLMNTHVMANEFDKPRVLILTPSGVSLKEFGGNQLAEELRIIYTNMVKAAVAEGITVWVFPDRLDVVQAWNFFMEDLNDIDDEKVVVFRDFRAGFVWVRDYGPYFAIPVDRNSGEKEIVVDHQYGRCENAEEDFPSSIAKDFMKDVDSVHNPIEFQYGNLQADGTGRCIVSDEIFHQNGDGTADRQWAISWIMNRGCPDLLIVKKLPYDGTGHVDLWLAWHDEKTLFASVYDPAFDQLTHDIQQDGIARIKARWPDVEVVLFPMPPHCADILYCDKPRELKAGGYARHFTRTFLNQLRLGKKLIVPYFPEFETRDELNGRGVCLPVLADAWDDDIYHGEPTFSGKTWKVREMRAKADALFKQYGYEPVWVPADGIIQRAGAVHCISNTVPAQVRSAIEIKDAVVGQQFRGTGEVPLDTDEEDSMSGNMLFMVLSGVGACVGLCVGVVAVCMLCYTKMKNNNNNNNNNNGMYVASSRGSSGPAVRGNSGPGNRSHNLRNSGVRGSARGSGPAVHRSASRHRVNRAASQKNNVVMQQRYEAPQHANAPQCANAGFAPQHANAAFV